MGSLCLKTEIVELLRCRHSFSIGADHLPLFDHVHRFDASNDDGGTHKGFESHHWSGDPLDGPMVLLDKIVEIFRLTHFNVHAGLFLNAFNCSRIGTTLIDGDLLRRLVQGDGPLQKLARCGLISRRR